MSASDYLESAMLNHILRTATFAKPATVAISLHSAAPDEDGTPLNELTGSGYARVDLGAPANATWNAPSAAGLSDNVAAITFPEATADWVAATHIGINDAASGGNLLIAIALSVSKTILSGETGRFAAGALDVTVD